ncbi:MAG: glycosyltransferase family 39 protein [bacterium]|nr:MAG: glycosyltransferase family 39 protein [bacterium]
MRSVQVWNRKTTFLLIVILVVGASLRFYGLTFQSLSNDELSSWQRSRYDQLQTVIEEGVRPDVHPPGYFMLLHLVQKTVGDSETALRFSSALFGVLSILFIYLLGLELYSYREALTSAGLMAVLWCPIFYSQDARPYAMLLLFTLLSTYLWTRMMKSLREDSRLPHPLTIGYIAAAVICAYAHYFGLYLVALQGLTGVILTVRNRRSLVRAVLVYGVITLAYAPWFPILWEHLNRGPIWIGKPGEGYFNTLLEFIEFLFNQSKNVRNIALVFIFIFIAHLYARIVNNPDRKGVKSALLSTDTVILLWFLIPFTGMYIKSMISVPVLTYRNLIISLPAVCLLVSRSLFQLPIRKHLHTILACAGTILLLYHLVLSMDYYRTATKQQFREIAGFVVRNQHRGGNALIVSETNNPNYINYYFKQMGSDLLVDINIEEGVNWNEIDELAAEKGTDHGWYLSAAKRGRGHIIYFERRGFKRLEFQGYIGGFVILFGKEENESHQVPVGSPRDVDKSRKVDQRFDETVAQLWQKIQASGDPKVKIEGCRVFLEEFSDHELAPKALFMIGFIYAEELKDKAGARVAFNELLRAYPGSSAAETAMWMLKNMDKKPPVTEE